MDHNDDSNLWNFNVETSLIRVNKKNVGNLFSEMLALYELKTNIMLSVVFLRYQYQCALTGMKFIIIYGEFCFFMIYRIILSNFGCFFVVVKWFSI